MRSSFEQQNSVSLSIVSKNSSYVIDGDISVAEMGQAIFEHVLEVASGRQSKSEVLGFGDEEFVPWQIGAVM